MPGWSRKSSSSLQVIGWFLLACVLVPAARPALAQPGAAGDLDAALAALRGALPGKARLDAAAAVIALGPTQEPALLTRLASAWTSTDGERRAVLKSIDAEVPGPSGRFEVPPARRGKKLPELDWLALLAARSETTPALLDSVEIVTLLRALGAARSQDAAMAIFDFGFSEPGTAFRDECGRTLRGMDHAAMPTLLRASQDKARAGGSAARYATYQLDRMGKNRPAYALAAAPDEEWEIAMLRAIRDVHHPDAVTAVLERTDDASVAVRKEARETWLAYVTGPPPPPAPKKKRKLPGGRLTEALPLYLNYREFATNEVRRVLTMQSGGEPDKKASAEDMTRLLWKIYDDRRGARWDESLVQAQAALDAGKLDDAQAIYDRILKEDPTYPRRATFAPGYVVLAKAKADGGRWDEAARLAHTALVLDPKGPAAHKAEAQLYYARSARAGGGAEAESARARAASLDPSGQPGVAGARATSGPPWLLVAAAAAALLALLAGLAGARQRRLAAGRT